MPARPRLLESLRLAGALLVGVLWVLVLHPLWRRSARGRADRPWVIGGHGGRRFDDNSAAVALAAQARGHRVIWLGNPELEGEVRARGLVVLRRHGLAARRALSEARVLVYSHGEDDLDPLLLLLRGRTALRCYLNHCLNLLKAGGVHEPGWDEQPRALRALRTWLITDCDRFFTASPAERENFERSYPMHRGKFRDGGGAHLDAFAAFAAPPRRRIYWFPTFRETPAARRRLAEVIAEVTSDQRLATWLREQGTELLVGAHVNLGEFVPELEAPFRRAEPARLVEDLTAAELLISDYSSVAYDFLLSGRAPIFFAFDLDDYERRRRFYQDYRSIDHALVVRTVPELVEALLSGAARDPALLARARAARERLLPPGTGGFAARTVGAIERELAAEGAP